MAVSKSLCSDEYLRGKTFALQHHSRYLLRIPLLNLLCSYRLGLAGC